MASDLTLDFEDHIAMNNLNDTGTLGIDQDGEWDMSIFDELGELGDANELLKALDGVEYVPDLDFDMDLPSWSPGSSTSNTDGDLTAASPGAHSPYSSPDEASSPQPQASPLSICSDSSGFSELAPETPPQPPKRTRTPRAQPVKRPIQCTPTVSIQPKAVLTAVPFPTVTATPVVPIAKTIILQPLAPIQTLQSVLPMVKPAQVAIQPAPPATHPMLLPQAAHVLQIQTSPPLQTKVVSMPTLPESHIQTATDLLPAVNIQNASPDNDSNSSRRQMRMIKNRESASLSRKKKKEYLLTLEARLKVALSENAQLKCENGTLKEQLQGLVTENTVLKSSHPKRRAVCLMVLVVFLVFNLGPMSLHTDYANSGPPAPGPVVGRHLLGTTADMMAPEEMPDADRHEEPLSEERALMVVRESPLVMGAATPCQPSVNRTKCIRLAHELRGWVHRHEVERTKSRRQTNTQTKSRTILRETDNNDEATQHLPVHYADSSERISGNELQIYYAPHRTYQDFFEEINRRGDTFYVVSFRRDHLLLPATSHNKGSRPKMSVVLPAMNINDSVIKDKEFEVMMQIDCEVMDTRILHIKASSIPPFLRANQTHNETYYHPNPSTGQATPTVGVLVGSA